MRGSLLVVVVGVVVSSGSGCTSEAVEETQSETSAISTPASDASSLAFDRVCVKSDFTRNCGKKPCPSPHADAALWIPHVCPIGTWESVGCNFVGDDNSTTSVISDSDKWWWKYFGNAPFGTDTNQNDVTDDIDNIDGFLGGNSQGQHRVKNCKSCVGTCFYDDPDLDPWCQGEGYGDNQWWYLDGRTDALIKMYDLMASIDTEEARQRAMVYLERLRQMANANLRNRDDIRAATAGSHFPAGAQSPFPPPPYDTYHHRVMPGWGRFDAAEWIPGWNDGTPSQWTTYVTQAHFFTLPMAAFARRVADHPQWFCNFYKQEAVKFINAVMETYAAYRVDMGAAYYKAWNGEAWPYNENFGSLRPMVEIASAANSDLYKSSPQFDFGYYVLAVGEAPEFIRHNVEYFVKNIKTGDPAKSSSGTAPWYYWLYTGPATSTGHFPEDLNHGEFTMQGLMRIWENRAVIGNLEGTVADGRLSTTLLTRLANTFLQRIWYYDYTPASSQRNLLTDRVDGPKSNVYPSPCGGFFQSDCLNASIPTLTSNANASATGFIPLSQVDPWVWVRARDSVFNQELPAAQGCQFGGSIDCQYPALNAQNHAFILRYR